MFYTYLIIHNFNYIVCLLHLLFSIVNNLILMFKDLDFIIIFFNFPFSKVVL